MAKKRSTSPPREAQAPNAPSGPRAFDALHGMDATHDLRDALEAHRDRLMTVEAILHCVSVAMDCEAGAGAHQPHYPTLIELARSLLGQSIDGLDSARMNPLLKALATQSREVRERPASYLPSCLPRYVH